MALARVRGNRALSFSSGTAWPPRRTRWRTRACDRAALSSRIHIKEKLITRDLRLPEELEFGSLGVREHGLHAEAHLPAHQVGADRSGNVHRFIGDGFDILRVQCLRDVIGIDRRQPEPAQVSCVKRALAGAIASGQHREYRPIDRKRRSDPLLERFGHERAWRGFGDRATAGAPTGSPIGARSGSKSPLIHRPAVRVPSGLLRTTKPGRAGSVP